MTAETSNARGEWVLVPRNPTEAMIDAWRDAPNIWEDAYAAMLAAAPQTPSAPVGAQDIAVLRRIRAALPDVGVNGWIEGVRTLDRVLAALAQQPAARPPKPTECMNGCPDRQVCDHCQWPTGPDQQPAAVDEAMVERAWVAFCESAGSARQGIRAALTAALATQHQEPKS